MQGSLATRLMKWSISDFQPKSHPPRSHLRVAENLPEIIMQVGGLVVIQGQQMAKGMAVGQEHEHLLRRADSWKSLSTLHTLHTPGRGSECSTTRFRQNSESPSTQHSPAPGGQSEKASWRTEYKRKGFACPFLFAALGIEPRACRARALPRAVILTGWSQGKT